LRGKVAKISLMKRSDVEGIRAKTGICKDLKALKGEIAGD